MADNFFVRGIQALTNAFLNWLPENANRRTTSDVGNVSKTSPTLFDYDVFRINWEKVATLQEIDEMIKADPRIKRANKVFATTAIRRGLTIKVSSSVSETLAQEAQEQVDGFMRRTQLNAKLLPWARSLLKDGEIYLNPIIDVGSRLITDVKNLPAITMQRNEDIKGRFADSDDAFRQIDPVSRDVLTKLPLWAVNHIRYDHEAGQLYGNSQYLACRAAWKKLTMMEEDLVVRRRTRAIPRRLHKVGNDKVPGSWAEVDAYKVKNGLNNPRQAAVTTDYYGNGLTDIKDLNGDAHLDHIKDVEYAQELMMIGTGVPLHLLGFGKNVNRDIVEDQKKQFDEDVQELRDLLEFGDESPFSGIRALLDFQMLLQGIDPDLIDYNFSWAETNNETIDNKDDRVIKLRSAQPSPLISAPTALAYLGKDLNFENQEAIDAELTAIKEEIEEDIQAQKAVAATVNPEMPNKSNRAGSAITVKAARGAVADGTELTIDSEHLLEALMDAAKKRDNPLHSRKVLKLEKSLADDITRFFAAVKAKMIERGIEANIEKVLKLKPHFDSTEPMTESTMAILTPHAGCTCSECQKVMMDADVELSDLVEQHVIDEFDEAWKLTYNDQQEGEYKGGASFRMKILESMIAAGELAFHDLDEQAKQAGVGVSVSTNFVHSGVAEDLETEAGKRIRGIENTTRQLLRKEFAEAYKNGETLKQWMGRIDKVMDIPEWRSSMIARTELSWAYNRANRSAYDMAGVHKVKYIAVLDNRTCPICRADNGEIFDRSEVPSLPRHPRCRCTTTAVF